jgi:hypothetical protein
MQASRADTSAPRRTTPVVVHRQEADSENQLWFRLLLNPANDDASVSADTVDPDEVTGVGGLDHGATAHIHRFMVGPTWTVEKQISGLDVGQGDVDSGAVLRSGIVREADADLGVGPHDQARTVEARRR